VEAAATPRTNTCASTPQDARNALPGLSQIRLSRVPFTVQGLSLLTPDGLGSCALISLPNVKNLVGLCCCWKLGLSFRGSAEEAPCRSEWSLRVPSCVVCADGSISEEARPGVQLHNEYTSGTHEDQLTCAVLSVCGIVRLVDLVKTLVGGRMG